MTPDREALVAYITPPRVGRATARRWAATVAGLARLSGYTRMQVHRLVRAGKVVPDTAAARRWAQAEARKRFAVQLPDGRWSVAHLPLNNPRRRAVEAAGWAALRKVFRPTARGQRPEGISIAVLDAAGAILGVPTDSEEGIRRVYAVVERMRDGAGGRREVGGGAGGLRRKQKPADLVLRAVEDARAAVSGGCVGLRAVARRLGVNAGTLSRWLAPGGHLHGARGQIVGRMRAGEVGAAGSTGK